jgi:hypothetical protein
MPSQDDENTIPGKWDTKVRVVEVNMKGEQVGGPIAEYDTTDEALKHRQNFGRAGLRPPRRGTGRRGEACRSGA